MPDSVHLTLPAMGESVSEGTVARWLKSIGDQVAAGEPVVEVTTDKVDVEVPAPASGRLEEILAAEGDTIAIGAVLGTIAPGVAGETPAPSNGSAPAAQLPATAPAVAPSPPRTEVAAASPVIEPGSLEITPLARRSVAMRGLDPARLHGTGPGGQVRRADALALPPGDAPLPPQGVPVTPLRGPAAALVEYMEQSRAIPTATSVRVLPVRVLDMRRGQLNQGLSASGRPGKVSFTHLIAYAIVRAAHAMTVMANSFARDASGTPLRVHNGIHLGLAVDSQRKDGSRFLVVPVIRDADQRDFAGFRAEYERLIERARANALSPDELRGASLTLTNPGGIGTVMSIPRLMPGQGCIVATGAIAFPPEWRAAEPSRRAELGIGKVMTMTSTYDHRVIQGAESGEFLARVEALLDGADDFYGAVFASMGVALPAPAPATPAATGGVPVPAGVDNRRLLAAMQAATSLIKAHRTHGHLGAHLDPLGSEPIGDPSMDPGTYGLTPDLMASLPRDLLRVSVAGETLADVLPRLREVYCGSIAYEIEHISSHEQRVWLREQIESSAYRTPPTPDARIELLRRLTRAEVLDRYLRRTFLGQKTFSGEGVDAMIPMLQLLVESAGADGVAEVVIGMSHRGRLNVISHVVNRPYETVLQAFERGEQRRPVSTDDHDPTGDVKYHIGATGSYELPSGRSVTVRLLNNPSHLEAVDGVVEGWARAEQTQRLSGAGNIDLLAALPVLIHGDAAFAGQGVVAEVLNMQALAGYATGGTVHIIANNQVGFTTDPRDDRSTRYASDLAKGFDLPIIHVNADDVEAAISALRLAYAYRTQYHRDVVIDLIGYRRMGHNETDEPSYTQPQMYRLIRSHPTVRELYAATLAEQGLVTAADADAMVEEAVSTITEAHRRVRESLSQPPDDGTVEPVLPRPDELSIDTTVAEETLRALNEQLVSVPEGFTLNPKLPKQLERRRQSLAEGGIDWGTAEAFAFGSLLLEGHPIRLTGQDTERGTFSHRHLAYHDDRTGDRHVPMQHLIGAHASFELWNSPLSEVGALSFEYGYSAAANAALVLWEAQFGDFTNNAQMVVDQFIVAGQAKWGQRSRLVLLLPHGYEGMGPEHSSARLERFLQLSANGNIRVANCSTSAQYFHLLRNQALLPAPRPLVILTPKSLLRMREAGCSLEDLTQGGFQPVMADPSVSDPAAVTTLLLCTGRVYYDLQAHPDRASRGDLAVGRVEMLDPVPAEQIAALIGTYPNLATVAWVQEEPANMGAWPHLRPTLEASLGKRTKLQYVGRSRRASPSEGYAGSHHLEQERIVGEAMGLGRTPARSARR